MEPVAERPPPLSLLKASLGLAAALRASGDLNAVADRLERADHQPYPMTYVLMSVHVITFLRALAAEQARPSVQIAPLPQRLQIPPVRESGTWTS